jgi:hypothetical protein
MLKYVLIVVSYLWLFLLLLLTVFSAENPKISNRWLALAVLSIPWVVVAGANLYLYKLKSSKVRTTGLALTYILLLPFVSYFFCIVVTNVYVR